MKIQYKASGKEHERIRMPPNSRNNSTVAVLFDFEEIRGNKLQLSSGLGSNSARNHIGSSTNEAVLALCVTPHYCLVERLVDYAFLAGHSAPRWYGGLVTFPP